jgi:hypothetical protein
VSWALIEFEESWLNYLLQQKQDLVIKLECGGEEEHISEGGDVFLERITLCAYNSSNFTSSEKSGRAVLSTGGEGKAIVVARSQSIYSSRELPKDTMEGMDFSLEVKIGSITSYNDG